ncbi:MAG: hypothetical protein KGM16_00695 [Bacteroidota bacterium]|nr:hypothetical protein [Bacteroidota bacterium]
MINPILKRFFLSSAFIFFGCFLLSAQQALNLKYKRSTIYAGIEVGSKGVKMSLIEMNKNSRTTSNYSILLDTAINTDFISFTPATFKTSLQAISYLYNTAFNFYHIPATRIYTVVSSGVKVSAEKSKRMPWIQTLIDSFKIRINDSSRKVAVIDAAEEARLSHLGIVPESKRFTTFLIDIGSGNTKGGYFPNDNTDHIKLFQLTWGTQSTDNAAINRLDGDNSINNYYRQLQRVLQGDANKEITYAVNVSGAYNMSDNVAFSGGAAWATATLLFPELNDDPVVPVTYEQVEKFSEKLYSDYNAFSEKQLIKRINDNTLDKVAIAQEIKTVNKVFDQRAMLAASGLLLKIMRQFDGLYERKQFYLIKNGEVGWISAYVNKSIGE